MVILRFLLVLDFIVGKPENPLVMRLSGHFILFVCTTFAWFTSKDEVTNRLSASGDYDVSIVESFAPPAKWVPGQAVNKDVYAVNTGDVDAYVKETVSSVLTIVREKATENLTKPDAECIELSAAERYVVEAGAFLAYAPEASAFTYDAADGDEKKGLVREGRKVIAMNPDFNDENGYTSADPVTDFMPDAEGLYVFRRTIGVDDDTQIENYTYDGYYYVPGADGPKYKWTKASSPDIWSSSKTEAPADGYAYADEEIAKVEPKFYKISNLTVEPVKATFAGDRDDTDGILKTASSQYWKDVTETVVPELTYDATNNRLVAVYNTGTPYDPSTIAATKQKLYDLAHTYEDKAIAYEDALEEYKAAVGDMTGRSGSDVGDPDYNRRLADATAELQSKLADLLAATRARDAAQTAYDTEFDNMQNLTIERNKARDARNAASGALGTEGAGAYDPDTGTNDTAWGRYLKANADLGETNAPDNGTDNSAYGVENTAKKARDDADDVYEAARAARAAAVQDERNAFLDLVINKLDGTANQITGGDQDTKRTNAAAYLDTLSAAEMEALAIANPADGEYNYYRLLVDEKYAKEDVERKQNALDTATEKRVAAENALAIAEAELAAAQAAAGDSSNTTAMYNPTTGANDNAQGRYLYAQYLLDESMKRLYGNKDGGTTALTSEADGEADEYTAGSLYGVLEDKKADYNDKKADADAAQAAFDTAKANSKTGSDNVTAKANALAKAKQEMDDAWTAYETAKNLEDGKLKININLADVVTEGGVADKWQLLPESLEDKYNNVTTAEGTDNIKDTASFYYTSVLGGGQTTSKLIDSVELDETVTQDMFKYFDFDLNIALKSVQVNIDSNGNYTAETAQTELGKYAILSQPGSADSTITWSDTATIAPSAAPKTYSATAGTNNYTITEYSVPKTIDFDDYKFELVDAAGNKYYSDVLGGPYKKYDAANDTLLDTGAGNVITLSGTPARTSYTKNVTFKDATGALTDVPATYTYDVAAITWSGTAPTTAPTGKVLKYCATNSNNESDWNSIEHILGTPTEDSNMTVYYKLVDA